MKNAQQQLLIACLAMLLGGNVFAADPPKDAPKADAKKEEKKDEPKKDEKKDEAKKDGKDGKEPPKAEAPTRRARATVQAVSQECHPKGFRAQGRAEERRGRGQAGRQACRQGR